MQSIARQIAELARAGHEILVVHGGGKIFTATLARMGIDEPVRERAARDGPRDARRGGDGFCRAAEQATGGRDFAGRAAGGGHQRQPTRHVFWPSRCRSTRAKASLGFVGYLTEVNLDFLRSLWSGGIVPVASCLGLGADGELYNINADHMAAAAAEFVHADRLIFLTDVAGVLDGKKCCVRCAETRSRT